MKTMKKLLSGIVALGLALVVMTMPVSAAAKTFDDVEAGSWYADSVYRWSTASIIAGYEGTDTFGTEDPITRGQVATILSRIIGLSDKGDKSFPDLTDETAYYYDHVLYCANAGIVNGTLDENEVVVFRPEDHVSREQAFTMIARALKVQNIGDIEACEELFPDWSKVDDWAKDSTAALVKLGVISGVGGTGADKAPICPDDDITRAAFCTVLDRMIGVYVDEKGNVSTSGEKTVEEYGVGNVVVVNAKQEDLVEVSAEADKMTITTTTENGQKTTKVIETISETDSEDGSTETKVVITTTVTDVSGTVVDETVENIDTKTESTEEKVSAPVLVHGTTNATIQEDQTIVVEKVEEKPEEGGGSTDPDEKPVEQKHLHMAGKIKNCAVASDVANVCYTDPENCEYHTVVEVPAAVHNFVNGNCTVCGLAEKYDKDKNNAMKFHANITSNGESVDVNVTNDYAAKMVITPGKVDAAKATVTVEMQDVASMGVTGIRKEEKTFETGLTGDPELKVWLSEAFDFEGGKINATIEDKATLYNVTGAKDGNNAVITATPADVDATRAAWAELTSHIDSETKEVEDSYIVVANGSYMVVGNDMLSFEKGNVGDLTLDAFSTKGGMAALEKEIRDKVQLNTSDVFAKEGYEFQFYLAAGTKLAVSNSVATLADDCFITVNADSIAKNAELDKILPELQAAEGGYAMAEKLVKLLNQMIGCVDGDTIDVNITFSEPEEEKDTKFYFGVTANNADGKGTTTVDMEVYDDYSLEINLPMNKISASEVTLDVEMNNVASLGVTGTKKHSQTVNTGMTATGDLNFWMSNAPKFEGAMIKTTIVDADGEAFVSYNLESDMDADWVTITGTTNTEHARAAWAKIANNVATSENTKGDDSYILVNKNSFVQIGTEMLDFEDGADDMLLDNFSNLNAVKQEIKDSVKLVEANEDEIVLYVGAGTTLAVSESVATLEKDAKIVVSASNAIPEDTLSKIQAAADDNNALVKELFTLLNNMIGSMNNGVVNVQISFLEPEKECDHLQERRTNCAVAETAYCECGEEQFDLIAIPHTFDNDVCIVCGMTEDEAMKFEAKISSNGNYVETVVTNDYAAQVTVTPGNVDASKVDLYIAMQDVASLDITGKREENKTVSTGLSGNPALNVWLSNAFGFTSGKVEARVEGIPVGYELKGATVEGNAVITATPVNVEYTRAAWEELTKFVTTESQSSSDSYVEIANGSFMIVGDDMLSFEDDVEGNLKLDGFTANNGMDSVENEIRSKVKLTTDASLVSDDYEAQFYLAKGTKLAISNSIATIDENCVITLCGDGLKGEDFANILPELQKAESGYAMAEKLVKMINAMIGSADGHTVGIDITFVEHSLNAPVVTKVEAIDVTPVYSANTVVVEEVVEEETTEEPVVEEVVEEETTEEPVVEEVVEEETTEESVVEEVVEEETTEEPVVEEVAEEETTEESAVEEVVEEATEEPVAE